MNEPIDQGRKQSELISKATSPTIVSTAYSIVLTSTSVRSVNMAPIEYGNTYVAVVLFLSCLNAAPDDHSENECLFLSMF